MTDDGAGGRASPPPGWLADPEVPGGLRWWDGGGWTEHRSPTPPPYPMPYLLQTGRGFAVAGIVLGWVGTGSAALVLLIFIAAIVAGSAASSDALVQLSGLRFAT